MNKIVRATVVAAASMGALAANAATGDPDTSAITSAATTVGTIGAAVFAVYVGVKLFKWARSAL